MVKPPLPNEIVTQAEYAQGILQVLRAIDRIMQQMKDENDGIQRGIASAHADLNTVFKLIIGLGARLSDLERTLAKWDAVLEAVRRTDAPAD